MLTEEQLRGIEAQCDANIRLMPKRVRQLLAMVRELQGRLRVCTYDLTAAEDGMVKQTSLIVERLEGQVRELQINLNFVLDMIPESDHGTWIRLAEVIQQAKQRREEQRT